MSSCIEYSPAVDYFYLRIFIRSLNATTTDAGTIFDIASTPSRVQYGTVHIYAAVTDVNTVIAVNDVNTVNVEPIDIGDSCLMYEQMSTAH